MMDELFEKDKGSIKKSVNFNQEQKQRVKQLAIRLRLVKPSGKIILSPTVNTAIFLANCFLDLRDEELKETEQKIKKWNLTIPEVFNIGETHTLYSTLNKVDKKKFVTLSEQKRG